MQSPATVTLRDIARKAGVSAMTVSRALRNEPALSAETKSRVQEMARQMGYRPNPLVAALMRYRRTGKPVDKHLTLALVTNFPTRDGWREVKYNRDLFEGVCAGVDRHGYKLEEFWLREPKMTAHRMSEVLYHRGITGLIIAPLAVADGHLRLAWDKFSAVTLGYSLVWPALHRAAHHQFRSVRLAIRRLRKLGYRRFGLALRASSDERVDHHWLGGFLAEHHRSRRQEHFSALVLPDRDWKQAAFARWFRRHRPEVILSVHARLITWLDDLGARVPGQVGFVHLDCPDREGTHAGIYTNGPQIGSAAVDFLVGMLQRNERGIPVCPTFVLIDGTWQDGATLR